MAVDQSFDHDQEDEETKTETRNETEKWIKHYSSLHQILLVGDGDFSFSLCLAKAFGSASNMVATSLDQYDVLTKNYQDAKSNLESLRSLGATIMHGVDATKMKVLPDLQRRKFDRIIYNFPHAGFHGKEEEHRLIKMHKVLVQGFFRNASHMLRPFGEVHINHKTEEPYDRWDLEDLAAKHNLALVGRDEFKKKDYPGYVNKRGSGPRCNESFALGKCSTYKFVFSHYEKKSPTSFIHTAPYQIQRIQPQVQNPSPFQPEPGHLTALPENQGVPPHTHNPTPLDLYNHTAPYQIRRIQPQDQNPPPPVQPEPGHLTALPENQWIPPLTHNPIPVNVYNPTRHKTQRMPPRPQNRILFDVGYPLAEVNMRSSFSYFNSPYAWKVSDICYKIFPRYFADTEEMFGRTGYHVGRVVHETLKTGFDRYMRESKERNLTGYIMHLEELHRYSVSRSEWLHRMLYYHDKQKMG